MCNSPAAAGRGSETQPESLIQRWESGVEARGSGIRGWDVAPSFQSHYSEKRYVCQREAGATCHSEVARRWRQTQAVRAPREEMREYPHVSTLKKHFQVPGQALHDSSSEPIQIS